jgi:transcriptional regulator with XRE-family HTH domain
LLRLREELGLTQRDVAELVGISARSYGDIERGQVRMPAAEAREILEEMLALRAGKKAA